jgi:hypothetical protein
LAMQEKEKEMGSNARKTEPTKALLTGDGASL